MSGARRALVALAWLAALVPPLLVGIVIAQSSVNVPYRDHWAFAPEVVDFSSGRYRLAKLWQPSGQHRIVPPKAIMLALVPFTRWDVRVETWLSFAFVLVSLGLLADLARRSLRPFAPSAWIWTVPLMSAALFSLAAWHSWTFGWMINVYLVILGIALTAWSLGAFGASARGIALMLLGATIAAYSYLSGLLLLLLVPIAVAVTPVAASDHGRRRRVAIAALIALALFGAYFIGYPSAQTADVVARARPSLVELASFLLRYLGSPLSGRDPESALALGACGSIVILAGSLLAFFRSHEHRRALLPWLVIAVFAVANAAATASGRFAGRPNLALYSRYAMMAAPFWSALPAFVVLGASAARVRERPVWVRSLLGAAIVVALALVGPGYVQSNLHGLELTASRKASLEIADACLHDIESSNDRCLKRVSRKNFELVRRMVPRLERLGLGPFAGTPPSPRAPLSGEGS